MDIERNKKSYKIKTLFVVIMIFSSRIILSGSYTNSNNMPPVDSFMIKIEKENKILDAIFDGDIHKVSKHTYGIDLNKRVSGGSTYLIEAIYAGSIEITKLLLDKRADPNLRAAPFHDVNDELILEESPLEVSFEIENGFDITKMLIVYGADINSKDAQGNTLLHKMLKPDEEVMTKEQSFLYSHYGNRDMDNNLSTVNDKIKWLIKKGADVNTTNLYGETPLLTAAWSGDYEAAELLLKGGADAKVKDYDGKTALFYCTSKGFAKKLIKKGADIKAQDKAGLTALHMAVFENNIEIVKLFIQSGADLNIRDSDSRLTPLEWMIVDWYPSSHNLAKYLISKGAVYDNSLVIDYGLTEEFYKIKKELGK